MEYESVVGVQAFLALLVALDEWHLLLDHIGDFTVVVLSGQMCDCDASFGLMVKNTSFLVMLFVDRT